MNLCSLEIGIQIGWKKNLSGVPTRSLLVRRSHSSSSSAYQITGSWREKSQWEIA